MLYEQLPAPTDEEIDVYLASLMIKEYGDLLKISRTRSVAMPLPALRKYVADNEYLLQRYELDLRLEIEGQGLEEDAALNALVVGQLKALREADNKNNTKFANEIKTIVSKGTIDAEAIGQAQQQKSNKKDLEARIQQIVEEPLQIDIDKITDSFLEEVTDVMNKFYPSEYIYKSLIYHKGSEDVTYVNTFPQTEQNNG